ncbi:MAG: hypothetical protein OXI63_26200 [Candidatus Poribacteria bacterium]|nr:hypothetical protein [Candidatus Poribacteria bacterium]
MRNDLKITYLFSERLTLDKFFIGDKDSRSINLFRPRVEFLKSSRGGLCQSDRTVLNLPLALRILLSKLCNHEDTTAEILKIG